MPGASPAAADNPAEQSRAWAALLEKLVRGLEGGSREWTSGRRKDSVRRVIAANRSDMQRLRQRLEPLLASWDADPSAAAGGAAELVVGDRPDADVPVAAVAGTVASASPALAPAPAATAAPVPAPAPLSPPTPGHWPPLVASLESTVRAALPADEPRAAELADQLALLAQRIQSEGATAEVALEIESVCDRSRRLLAHRQHLLDELGALCASLTDGLTELSEDDSWARGQAEAMRSRLAEGINARSVRIAAELLAEARVRQQRVRAERDAARDALRGLIPRLLGELAALDEQTGRFEGQVGQHAQAIGRADTLAGLADVVRQMVDDTHAVQQLVGGTRARLSQETSRAAELQSKVQTLELELRRLSDEVSTDALTKVANRRGLQTAFEAECARLQRGGETPALLSVGLIDIDNFKKLNDTLGHGAGDVALATLAGRVRDGLRPIDTVARFGGEEFVVLLPATPVAEAQVVLTRLQRGLSAALFMHENREVFVTFSGGVTSYRPGETLAVALERADEALYEAKRTGKNRTCVG